MDNKNDDSAGSDSLDKSLQKKCVVDDVGQGEGAAQDNSKDSIEKKDTCSYNTEERPSNSKKYKKNAKSVGDGGIIDGIKDESAKIKSHTKMQDDSFGATGSNTQDVRKSTCNATTNTASSNNNNFNTFETKVKQISKNLKETTLAESANKKCSTSLEDYVTATTSSPSSTSSSSSSSSVSSSSRASSASPAIPSPASSSPASSSPVSTSPVASSPALSASPSSSSSSSSSSEGDQSTMASSSTCNTNQAHEMDTSMHSTNDSLDDQDHRSKKVRFHPDVKENDGGNRVIPKKKKKLKASPGCEDLTAGLRLPNADEEMDLDEEDDVDEEDEFDLSKTIEEAQDYLKTNPLTFVRLADKMSGRLQNGLLDEEDLMHLADSSEDEEFYEQADPENGVERILGKHIKSGKIEFLLRYAERSGLYWESEEIIVKQCPNLLNKYEQNRERRQERLMRHVAKRQNVRQRYTDF